MFTWTYDTGRAALTGAALLLFLVSACGGESDEDEGQGRPAPRQIAVTADQVAITGPRGFCVDPTATRDRTETAFVLLGNCAVISNLGSSGEPRIAAVLTASVSDADPDQSLRDSIPELDEFFRTENGRALLSRSGDGASVAVIDSFHQGDVFFLHARDSSAGDVQDVTDEYWRAYLDIGTRIVTLSVLGLSNRPPSGHDSLATLRDFVDRVTDANEPGAEPVLDEPERTGLGTFWNIGLIRRIMG